ncbi:MAG: glycosyl hydrolase [Bacteroidia bacterium]|nr:glycosyl hydrolase [Bacteroidia bacterium]
MRFHKTILSVTCFLTLVSQSAFGQVDTSYFSNLSYRNLGPNRGGRSTAVVGDLNNRDLFYMGTTGGGVWKTTNGGTSWKNISDGYFGGSIGSISVAPSDDNVIYVGQGEESLRGNVSFGNGVWKSEDAGVTWQFKGLKNGRHITRIAVHPTNADIVYAAVLGDLFVDSEERGLYRTENGGDSWEKVLFGSPSAGCNEVVIDPMNHRNIYASTWKVRRTPHSFSSGGEGCGLWKSTDGGATWNNILENNGLPKSGLFGKITVSVSPVQKNLVFAMIENKSGGGLYRSADGGKNWELVNREGKIRQRAWYFSRVYCDTKEPNTVYVMNVRFQKSVDGGKTFKAIQTPHVDHHDLWIDPNDNQRMITANDGGGQVSYNGGNSWSTYMNQPTEQFYRVSTDNHIPYRIYGAQQDNSTMRVNHLTGQWEPTAGGESAHIAIDPENNDLVYAGSYGGYLTMFNHKTKDRRAINVWPDNPMGYGVEGMKYRFQWNFPVFFSPHNKYKLYTASNHLHVSYNGGESWNIISPDLTRNDSTKMTTSGGPITKDNTGVEYYCTIFAATESALEQDVIWVGSDDGLLHITRDGGQNWVNITPKGLPEWTMINSIEADPFQKGVAYVVATSYKLGDYRPYIYRVSEYGKHAELIVNGIEKDHFVRVVRTDNEFNGILYAGTERGMYISYNHGKEWQTFQLNLPEVPITDLALKDNDLVVATQGRGFWILDNLSAVRLAKKDPLEDQVAMIATESGHLVPRGKVSLVYYLKDTLTSKDTLMLDVLDSDGKSIRTFSNVKFGRDTITINPKTGMNYQHWSMRLRGAQRPSGMILWWASTSGPKAKPGDYSFRLRLGDYQEIKPFQIGIDPSSDATPEDYVAKTDFLVEVVDKLDETHKALERMTKLSGQLEAFRSGHDLPAGDTILVLIDSLTNKLSTLKNELYQTKNRSEQDPINFPIKLNNKLAHLNSLVSMGNFGPTVQAVKVKNEIITEIDKRLEDFKRIQEESIPAFNQLLLDRNVQMIRVD